MTAFRAVWRYRWEVVPFLLVGAVEAFPVWVFAARNYLGLPFTPYTRWQHGHDALMLATGYALWLLPSAAAIVLMWYVIHRLDELNRPVARSLWSALLFVLLALSAVRALYFFQGILPGLWQDSYFLVHSVVILFGVGWAVRSLWSWSPAAALFVVSAAIIVRDVGGSWTLSLSNDAELLRVWLVAGGLVGAQSLLIVLAGVLAYHLPHQPARRQWQMTGGLSIAASGVLVAVVAVQEVMGTFLSVPYWYSRYFMGILEETGFLQAIGLNLLDVYAVAALAALASLGLHTLLPRVPHRPSRTIDATP